jgi:thiamine biosynthesis lipoprotein
MGTPVETTARYPDINYCKEALYFAYREMERVEDLLAYQKESSEISKINRAAGVRAVPVSEETFAILQRAVGYSRKLDGLFDVTIGPLSSLWGFSGPQGGHLPLANEIEQQRKLVDYRDLVLNKADTTVFLKKKGMLLDLGGIAKGYAIDRGSRVLKEKGVTNFILNAGGDMYVSGEKEENIPWKVGIKDPREGQKLVASFALKDYAVATSGDYERFIMVDGQRYHHILDPRSGYPGKLCRSTTTFAPTVEEADVMATYMFIIGAQQAQQKNIAEPFLIIDAKGIKTSNPAFGKLKQLQY